MGDLASIIHTEDKKGPTAPGLLCLEILHCQCGPEGLPSAFLAWAGGETDMAFGLAQAIKGRKQTQNKRRTNAGQGLALQASPVLRDSHNAHLSSCHDLSH